jgi:hypothetical protein
MKGRGQVSVTKQFRDQTRPEDHHLVARRARSGPAASTAFVRLVWAFDGDGGRFTAADT